MKTASQGTTRDIDIVRAALEPDYIVLEEIGRGGMAIVYRARERELDREVAIKVLPSAMALDSEFVDRFQREARTAGQLEHPNIVPIYRVGRADNVTFFVMKLLRGQSLAAVLRERGKLQAKEVRHILTETASALGFAAKRGVVHRDIKPDNILLDPEGRCVVTDFGIAKTSSGPLTAQGISMGTPRYMSPEHAQGTPVDGRSDIYSLGVVAYQCLTGVTPFNADDPFAILYKHINEPLPKPPLETKDEREVYGIVERMLAKKPEDRYQDANELLNDLGVEVTAPTLAASMPVRPKALTPTQVMTTPVDVSVFVLAKDNWRKLAGVAAAILVLITGGFFAFRKSPSGGGGTVTPSGTALKTALKGDAKTMTKAPLALAGSQVMAVAPPKPAPVKEPFSRCPRRKIQYEVMVDPVGPVTVGTKSVPVNYDVCGLTQNAPYNVEVTAWPPKPGGLGRLIKSPPEPEKVGGPEVAIGPRSRAKRTIDLSRFGPGDYRLSVVVTDQRNRQRKTERSFQIRDKLPR